MEGLDDRAQLRRGRQETSEELALAPLEQIDVDAERLRRNLVGQDLGQVGSGPLRIGIVRGAGWAVVTGRDWTIQNCRPS